jgi:excisionase family DNA binding protein
LRLLYDRSGASDTLSISERTLDRYVRDGKIKAVRVGGKVMFKLADLQAFIDSLGEANSDDSQDSDDVIPEATKKPRGRPRLAVSV